MLQVIGQLAMGLVVHPPRPGDPSHASWAAAREAGCPPDEFYALKLLDATGLVVVPGSGFGQPDPYAFHFRTTFLPPADQLESTIASMAAFHTSFIDEYTRMTAQRA